MHHPTAPKIPILNKSCLFVPVPSDPQNPNRRYLQCPATGHLYCSSTGSLYQKTIIPLSVNSSPLLGLRNNSVLLPSNSTPCTMKTSLVCTNNINQQDNGASTSTESNMSPKAKDVKQPIQGNNASMRNTVPSVKNANKKKQGTSAPKMHRNKASKSKVDITTQVNSPVQGTSSSSVCSQSYSDLTTKKEKSYSDLTTKKEKEKRSRKTKKSNSSTGSQSNPHPTTEKEMKHNTKTNKSNSYFSQSSSDPTTEKEMKPNTKTNKSNSYFNQSSSDPTTGKEKKHSTKTKKSNSYFSQSYSNPSTKKEKKRSRKAKKSNSSAGGQSNSNPTTEKEMKDSTKTKKSNSSAGGQSNSEKKKKKGKRGPVYQGFKISYRWLKPFNRRPYPPRDRQKSLLSRKYKNCIMASSVHEIIHSKFAKNTDEHMPVSQVRAMLSSGDRKLKMRNKWIQRMEEEAIHKYKKMNLEEHKERLDVKEYDVVYHQDKYWLVSYGRWVINRKDKETWPLMVKCLHKYPDSTLRQACKHHSFCLKWNGTYYTLRTDHAYYTQIQCHMAVTDTLYAELIVHTHKETTFLPVYFDSDFWKQTEVTLETFFTSNIQPYLKKIKSKSDNGTFRAVESVDKWSDSDSNSSVFGTSDSDSPTPTPLY